MARKLPGAKPKNAHKPAGGAASDLPTREAIIEAISDQQGLSGKRELARYFGIKGNQRAPFKQLLREMEQDGLLSRRRKTLRATSELPAVTVLDIPADADPEHMIAYPASWDEDEEGARPAVVIETSARDRVAPAPGNRILARITKRKDVDPPYSARAMKILDRPRRAQIGIVRRDDDGARLVPVDRKQKEMRIATGDLGAAGDGDLVEVEVKPSGRMMVPRARVTNVIGNPHAEGAISLIALHNLEIPYRFPQSVLDAAQALDAKAPGPREDWREMPFVTIDPATAKDHDDAVFAHPDEDKSNLGGHVVYVAIADVAAYVRPGTSLDKEAYLRGNSVYFPDRVVPMLPERISNDLCSLREKQVRPALAVRLVLDAGGQRKSHSFHRVTIRSAAKLAYEQAQAAIDGTIDDTTGPLLETVLEPLWRAFEAMTRARDQRAPLDLDLPERRIMLNPDGTVAGIHVPKRLQAHRLIEEMMIAANVCAAITLEKSAHPLIYRVHDSPGREKVAALAEFLKSLNLPFPGSEAVRPAHFNRILAKARAANQIQQVSEMVLRTQAQAEYAPQNYGHFGLNLDRYAHFTSPIRRYADLIVHRALIRALELGGDGLSDNEVQKLEGISQHISATERRAMAAERETADRLLAQFMAAQIGAQFAGKISGVTRAGLFVRLSDTGADGFVPAATLGKDYFIYVQDEQAMIGERTGERFRLGDAVTVRLLEAAPMAGALRFEILSDGEFVKKRPRRSPRGGARRGPPTHKSAPRGAGKR